MTLDEFKAAAARKSMAVRSPNLTDEDAALAVGAILADASAVIARTRPAAPAADGGIWAVLIQVILPILLAWIDRRFPKPTPPAPPA